MLIEVNLLMGKKKGSNRLASVLASWCSWFCSGAGDSGGDKNMRNLKTLSGPDAMVAAAKHFSSAHKIKFG